MVAQIPDLTKVPDGTPAWVILAIAVVAVLGPVIVPSIKAKVSKQSDPKPPDKQPDKPPPAAASPAATDREMGFVDRYVNGLETQAAEARTELRQMRREHAKAERDLRKQLDDAERQIYTQGLEIQRLQSQVATLMLRGSPNG